MKILDVEIDFNFFDANQAKKLEQGIDITNQEIDSLDLDQMRLSDFILAFCNAIEKCFDSTFGKGTSKKIFNGKKDFKACVQAYRDLVKARTSQEQELNKELDEMTNELGQATDYDVSRIKKVE